MHDLTLITTISAAFTAAWILGLLTQWLKLSPIVGYLIAGVLIGPHSPGFVGDIAIAQQLAEVGVILLMFGVGLHFHMKDLLAVRNVAVPGAFGQSLIATVAAMLLFSAFGMPLKTGAVLGMAMAVASTVVLMRVLIDSGSLSSPQGHVAVGWLIVEDIFTVVLLVLIPVMGVDPDAKNTAVQGGFLETLGISLLKLFLLTGILLWAGARVIPWILVRVAKLRSNELFTLTVLVFSVAIASASYFFFGASMALGAFLAGMVVAQSPVSHQAAADALPMRDTFAVLFFVSVGMLFDPGFLLEEPLMVLAALGIILVAKPLAALVIVAFLGHSVRTGLTVALGLAQIGEFSFILSEVARRYQLMPDSGHNVLVAGAILSITVNPLLFRALPHIERWLQSRPRLWHLLNGRAERRLSGPQPADSFLPVATTPGRALTVIVGYGPVGKSVHQVLRDSGVPTVVIDMNMDTVSMLHAEGQAAIFGDASNRGILRDAGAATASHLVVTVPDASQRAAVVAAGRALSQDLKIVVRARYLRERADLESGGASSAVFEEAEAAVALARMVLADTGLHHEAAERKLRDIRLRLIMDNISNIRTQRVASVMVPWDLVQTLSSTDRHQTVLGRISQQRFSRWPVIDMESRRPAGYLLTKDLISYQGGDQWPELIRPLLTIAPDTSIDAALEQMQQSGASIYLVQDGGVVMGIITLEDILEQVVGRLDDEQAREVPISVWDAVRRGAIVSAIESTNREQVIRELAAALPVKDLPVGYNPAKIGDMAVAREEEIPTDLGNGIAVPHARVPGLSAPIIVAGRSAEGIFCSADSPQLVRLFFLILTPEEHPDMQLALLARIARLAHDDKSREALLKAESQVELTELLHRFSHAG